MMATENKEDFIMHLHDRQMEASDRVTKILYQMIKEIGVPWTDMLQAGLDEQTSKDDKTNFYRDFVCASISFMAWMHVSAIRPFVPDEHVEAGIKAMVKDLITKLDTLMEPVVSGPGPKSS